MISARGTFRLSNPGHRVTAGMFNKIMATNEPTLTARFGRALVRGSLNLNVLDPRDLMEEIERAGIAPDVIIPRDDLTGISSRIGDHRFWAIEFTAGKVPAAVPCWLMRKVGTGLSRDHHEVLSTEALRVTYRLEHGDPFAFRLAAEEAGSW